MAFELHHRLDADCFLIGDFALSRALLMDDTRFPWIILVPRRDSLTDLHDLDPADRGELFNEIDAVSRLLQGAYRTDKINVAALGNQVPQLHVHVIGRTTTDPAWPGPVWGVADPEPYPDGAATAAELRAALEL